MRKFLRIVGFGWPIKPIMRFGQNHPYLAFGWWSIGVAGTVYGVYLANSVQREIEDRSKRLELSTQDVNRRIREMSVRLNEDLKKNLESIEFPKFD